MWFSWLVLGISVFLILWALAIFGLILLNYKAKKLGIWAENRTLKANETSGAEKQELPQMRQETPRQPEQMV